MTDDIHVDHFIDYGCTAASKEPYEEYARWCLNHLRLPAVCKLVFDQFMCDNLLFCKYKDKIYKVTGASRIGDVWLHSDFRRKDGYEHRVLYTECSAWSPAP